MEIVKEVDFAKAGFMEVLALQGGKTAVVALVRQGIEGIATIRDVFDEDLDKMVTAGLRFLNPGASSDELEEIKKDMIQKAIENKSL